MKFLKSKLLVLSLLISSISFAQLPSKVLVGYWENWGTLRLKDIDERYNVLMLSFLEADKNNDEDDNKIDDLEFTPTNKTQLKADIPVVQAQGRKVLFSIGGANGSFKLTSEADKNTFISKVKAFIKEYGVDGIDIDIERTIYMCPSSNQTITNPVSSQQYLIDGCKELLTWYQTEYGKKMIFTTAPEVSYTVGGTSPWNNCNGSFLPFVEQLKDDIDLLMIQLYNSGSIYSVPGYSWPSNTDAYAENDIDFIITATEAAIEGFKLPNDVRTSGTYSGIPANKIAVALTSCPSDEAYWTKSEIVSALKYLIGTGSKPGDYTLNQSYPSLKGLMTWSANIDAGYGWGSCKTTNTYQIAAAFEEVFGTINNSVSKPRYKDLNAFPNPTTGLLSINSEEIVGKQLILTDLNGRVVYSMNVTDNSTVIDLSQYAKGIYTLKADNFLTKIILK